MITLSTSFIGNKSSTLSTNVLSNSGNNGLGICEVQGANREPKPPAKTITCTTLRRTMLS